MHTMSHTHTRVRWFAARAARDVARAAGCHVRIREIIGRRRTARVAQLRALAIWLTRETSGASWPAVGRAWGRTHDTCLRVASRVPPQIAPGGQLRPVLRRIVAGGAS